MFDQPRSQPNKVVKLSPDGTAGGPPPIILTRLPVTMQALRDKARQQLQNLLRELFDKVDDAMFELADKATSNQDQNVYFDSMREVRMGRKLLETSFFRSIDISFAQLLDHGAYRNDVAEQERDFSLDDLSLVKNDDLEEIVAIEAMINKANEQFAEPIQHLTLRIDHLVPVKVYQKNNPLGADVICHAFNDSAKHLAIDVKARLVLFKLFDNLLMTHLGSVFQALNQLLIDANIMPSLKPGSVRVKRDAPSAADYYGAGISAGYSQSSASGGAPVQGTGPHYDEQTNHVLHALRDLLSSHHAEGAGAAVRGFGQEVASHELLRILSRAQQQNIASNPMLYSASAPLNVRELLQNLLASSSPGKHQPQINPVDDDVINLVSMMFDFILDDRNLAAPMKALIGRLQIPMVKVAIADKSFFSKGGHPARRLLNEMAMAALGWQESSEENLRKDSLYNKMEAVVQAILSDFDADMEIFGQLLADFREFLEKDKRRAKILEQRTIDAEAGMAKSDRARAQVESVLQRITSGYELPISAQKLLIGAWGNVLLIIALKQGCESEQWQGAIRTAQQLVWSLTAPMSKENRHALLLLVPELLQKLRQGLDDIAYSSYEAAQLFKQLEILHLARLKSAPRDDEVSAVKNSPAAQAQTALAANIQASAAEHRDGNPAAAAATLEQAADLPLSGAADGSLEQFDTINISEDELQFEAAITEDSLQDGDTHLVMVGNITQGSWFEMQAEDGQKFRCRLAAIIRSSGKYIFVNRSGMKVSEESRMSFALALKTGRLQLLDDGMLFDRALEAVIGTLRAKR